MKKFYTTILIALIGFLSIKAQKTLITQNFGGAFAHNESMSTNSSGWTHTGTGDFVHKIVSGAGAMGSNCFAQLGTPGAASASHDFPISVTASALTSGEMSSSALNTLICARGSSLFCI